MKPAEGSTLIGKSVVIRGDISGQEDLFLDGQVEGTVTLKDSLLTIGPNAHVRADLHVRDVIIFGRFAGNVHAEGRVDVRQSGSVEGDIFAGRISIEENAVLRGKVELKVPEASQHVPAAAAPAMPAAPESSAPLFSQPTA